MSNMLSKVVIFSVGATIGSAVTWAIAKAKFEHLAVEEIEAVREYYRQKAETMPAVRSVNQDTKNDTSILEQYRENIRNSGYESAATDKEEGKEISMEKDKPYVISPDDFDEMDDYETETLMYYEDDVLTDDSGNIINDVEKLIGKDSLSHFGEYEDDSVFVRNDKLKTDYEILADGRNYYDVY